MNCPLHKQTALEKASFHQVEVDFCPVCLGLFFNKEELRLAKDDKDENLVWLDVNLWKDKAKFKIAKGEFLCPACQLPMYTIEYADSGIKVEICVSCKGIWLDRGEFKKVIDYLQNKAQKEIWENYWGNLAKEIGEVFTGPETLKSEILDVLTIIKVLNYKFLAQFPVLTKIALAL